MEFIQLPEPDDRAQRLRSTQRTERDNQVLMEHEGGVIGCDRVDLPHTICKGLTVVLLYDHTVDLGLQCRQGTGITETSEQLDEELAVAPPGPDKLSLVLAFGNQDGLKLDNHLPHRSR